MIVHIYISLFFPFSLKGFLTAQDVVLLLMFLSFKMMLKCYLVQ